MKYLFIALLSSVIFSCKQPQNNTVKHQADSTTRKPAVAPAINDTAAAYTDAVYAQYVPAQVMTMLKEQLPGWQLPAPGTWEKYWFDAYKKDSTLVNYAPADFNGDHQPDYALLLKNTDDQYAVWVLQSQAGTYQAIQLYQLEANNLPLSTGIELLPAGQLNYMDLDADDNKTIQLQQPAIQVVFFEAAAETYYWKNGKYQSVTTGD